MVLRPAKMNSAPLKPVFYTLNSYFHYLPSCSLKFLHSFWCFHYHFPMNFSESLVTSMLSVLGMLRLFIFCTFSWFLLINCLFRLAYVLLLYYTFYWANFRQLTFNNDYFIMNKHLSALGMVHLFVTVWLLGLNLKWFYLLLHSIALRTLLLSCNPVKNNYNVSWS